MSDAVSVEEAEAPYGGSSAYPGVVPGRLKLLYSVGSAAEAIMVVAFTTFNFFFYTNILGVPGTLVGLATTIALVFDAVTDPLVGTWSDRWRSRLGRRHPFMFAAPLPVMLSLFFVYSPPQSLGSFSLFLWLTVLTVIIRSCMTFYHVPHLALGAELSADFTERTRIMSLNTLFGAIAGFATSYIAYSFFFPATLEHANGLLNEAAYPNFAIAASLTGGAVMLLSTFYTMGVIPRLTTPPDDVPRLSPREFLLDVRSTISNRNYLMLLIGFLLLSVTFGTRMTVGVHMTTYYWELLPEQIRYFALIGLVSPLVGFLAAAPLHNRFEKKPVLTTCLVCMLICFSAPVMLRIAGWFPANGSELLLPLLLAFYLLAACCAVIQLITAMSALADIADEHEIDTHRRQEGILYAARSFFAKASAGLGSLVAGVAIDIIEFPVGAEPGTIDLDTVFNLGLIDGPLGIIPGVMAIFFYAQYSLTRARHAEIHAELAARRENATSTPSPVVTLGPCHEKESLPPTDPS